MININMAKAKDIAHDKRRAVRAEKFKPLDIEATIPAMATEAEAKRQVIRDEDAIIQSNIDNVGTVEDLKAIVEGI